MPAPRKYPPELRKRSMRLVACRIWGSLWAADAARDIFDARVISKEGATVIVRRDQYVASVLPLNARGETTNFFVGILIGQLWAIATMMTELVSVRLFLLADRNRCR